MLQSPNCNILSMLLNHTCTMSMNVVDVEGREYVVCSSNFRYDKTQGNTHGIL
jgi:hypothetical protein